MTSLAEAAADNLTVTLRCRRTHAGMKSKPPCTMVPQALHVPTLVATFGPDLPIDKLEQALRCPGCGSREFTIGLAKWGERRKPRLMRRAIEGERPVLAERRGEWVVVACDRCGRRGEYKAETLAAIYGWEVQMASLIDRLAVKGGCRAAAVATSGETCGARYVFD